MKTAEESRMAMKSFNPKSLPGFKKIEVSIESAIGNDKNSVYLSDSIDSRLWKYLESIGYSVSSSFDRNETVTVISW